MIRHPGGVSVLFPVLLQQKGDGDEFNSKRAFSDSVSVFGPDCLYHSRVSAVLVCSTKPSLQRVFRCQ